MSATITTSAGTTNPLQELRKFGQSAWLDYIRGSLITGGELKRLVELQKRKDLDAMRWIAAWGLFKQRSAKALS
jgi:hypothetical protein